MTSLPGLVLIGAPKAGTTSLAAWWDQQPQGFTVPGKEIDFFWANWERGLDWYRQQFAGALPDQVTCDASPSYLYFDEALDRLRDTLPDARLAVVLRDPVSRTWSHWCYMVALGLEPRSFDTVLDQESADRSVTPPHFPMGYLDMSTYLPRLQAVTERFPREQLLVLLTDDLHRDPQGTFARLCAHGGIPAGPVGTSENTGRYPRSPRFQRFLNGTRASRWPGGVGTRLYRANLRPGPPPALSDSHRARLTELLAPQLPALQDWLGTPLPARWGLSASPAR